MSGNLLVINVDIREIRVALIEKGVIAELHIERLSSRSTLGNVCLGVVSRVLPGMQAAFIDIGQERAAFLHVEDLIRPDDFEAYLTGARDGRELGIGIGDEIELEDGAVVSTAAPRVEPTEIVTPAGDAPEDGGAIEEEGNGVEGVAVAPDESADNGADEDAGEGADAYAGADEGAGPGAEDDEAEGEDEGASADAGVNGEEEREGVVEAALEGAAQEDASDDEVPTPRRQVAEGGGERAEVAEGAERAETRGGRRRRSRRARVARSSRATRSGRGSNKPPQADKRRGPRRGDQRRDDQRRGDKRRGAHRISKNTPIREVVREGQHVIVQVTKEPIGTKGARVSSHVSLPGRYVVYLPTVDHVGISKRIGSDKERARLRATIEALKPPKGGFVVRTMAEGLTKKNLKNDIGYLVRLWDEIAKKREEARKAPEVLYEELDLVLKTARDLFTEEVDRIVIDNREQYARLKRFVQMFLPDRVNDIELYDEREPVFDAYGIEDEIGRALSRKVPLSSGGHLIIDQAEALTAIDVNTGRYVGKGQKDLEDTILQTNLEAVEEIAYQLRFRNIGGLIILDLIDMEKPSNRERVRRRLGELLARDKAKTTINRISDLGLIEMTRKRTRESLGRLLHEPCFYCDGTGQLMSKETIAYEILRQIRREQSNLKGYRITVNAHPAIVDLLKSEEREAVAEAERLFARRIELVPKKEYHIEQFDLQGL